MPTTINNLSSSTFTICNPPSFSRANLIKESITQTFTFLTQVLKTWKGTFEGQLELINKCKKWYNFFNDENKEIKVIELLKTVDDYLHKLKLHEKTVFNHQGEFHLTLKLFDEIELFIMDLGKAAFVNDFKFN